ncbi:MAG: M28 family peptidase [Gemmatimonadota bacterium]|nr:M28 family peptidase [Gemmatimonadota bacterium]
MRRSRSFFSITASLACSMSAYAQQQPIRGFPADALAAHARRESQLRAIPHPDSLRVRMRLLSEEPHEAGTDRSRKVAEQILARFKSFGLDARIEVFEALMPRPTSRTLEMVAPEKFVASLKEKPAPGDKDGNDANQLPTYNAYSADGDVTGELVFVNYGLPEDYRILDSLGISVRGKIVIAKYGRSWRGIKPKLAAEHGAIGCIIYSDPKDDGYFVDDVYTDGPMRPWAGVQRGSVMDMPTYPGDPLTPGWGSVAGSRKLARSEAKTLERIPVLPISYEDALPLLRNLGGPVAPVSWRGALPITYHIGAGPAKVHLALTFDWQIRPLYNVIARIPGARYPDQWLIHGNHHDAWVNGANDPISGMVALEETARGFGALLKTGWRPARTIILAGWDGEEWGLLGSTEWAEQHADELRTKAVAYLNSDSNGRGWIDIGGSHSLQAFMREVARDIRDPKSGKSVLDAAMERKRATMSKDASEPPKRDSVVSADDSVRRREINRIRGDRLRTAEPRPGMTMEADTLFKIDALGSGSDFTPFLQHLVVASLNISYGGDSNDGIYHSIHDTYDFYTRFLDTSFAYGVAESQTNSTALLRLADAAVLPFDFQAVVRTYRGYVDEIEKTARKNDTTKALDLGSVRGAIDRLAAASERYESQLRKLNGLSSSSLRARQTRLVAVNQILYRTERALGDATGLAGREWYRHMIYAPGFYTGYGVKTMPGIREAVEDRPNLEVARRESARVTAAIERLTAEVGKAAEGLEAVLK